jgi:hypothetical protein
MSKIEKFALYFAGGFPEANEFVGKCSKQDVDRSSTADRLTLQINVADSAR